MEPQKASRTNWQPEPEVYPCEGGSLRACHRSSHSSPRYTGKESRVTPEPGAIAVLAEKPSVARDIARILGATTKGDGYLHGNGYIVTWAIGHLVALPQPHEIKPEWRRWSRELLPMLPTE